MPDAMPIGVVAFSGSAITENLVDKARARRIPVRRDGGELTASWSYPIKGGPAARAIAPTSAYPVADRARRQRAPCPVGNISH
jgi:hypothetical protein